MLIIQIMAIDMEQTCVPQCNYQGLLTKDFAKFHIFHHNKLIKQVLCLGEEQKREFKIADILQTRATTD